MNLDDAPIPADSSAPLHGARDGDGAELAHASRSAGARSEASLDVPTAPHATLGATCDTLWTRGASVPLPIASALVTFMIDSCDPESDEACSLTLDDFVPLADGTLERHATTAAPNVPARDVPTRTQFDLALVAWELFVGKRITPSDVDERGEIASMVSARASFGPPLGSLERRALAEIDPVLARAFGHRGAAFASLGDFAKALDAAARPASRLRVAEWLRVARGPVLRAPLVTPEPPRVSSASESTRVRAMRPWRETEESALALLALVRDGAKRDPSRHHATKRASLPIPRPSEPESHPAIPWIVGLSAVAALVASMAALLR